MQERGLLKTVEGGSCGPVRVIGSPLQFTGAPFGEVPVDPPAQLGEHTHGVLRDLLHYDDARIDRLVQAGVVSAATGAN